MSEPNQSAANPGPSSSRPEQPQQQKSSHYLVGTLLRVVLASGLAVRPSQPPTVHYAEIDAARQELLAISFFDPRHKPHELTRVRRNPAEKVSFSDTVVVLARLLKIIIRENSAMQPLTEAEMTERLEVRNMVMSQAFFDRKREVRTSALG